ncbi:MAG: adenine deaminase [Pirellulaceae bacterium]
MQLIANHIDIVNRTISPAKIKVADGAIRSIESLGATIDQSLPYVLPGFIDAHIHIESSMLVPIEFARLACRHGTVAVVTDPHEIANVMGVAGIDFMIENAKRSPLKCCFGAPSCVPATQFETAGASIDAAQISKLLDRDDIRFLAEMMNFPGVLSGDAEVLAKIAAAIAVGKPVDGHAPGLMDADAAAYVAAGITTDHECTTLSETENKLRLGMKILIREGSAAKNLDALHSLIGKQPSDIMFCSDDMHPNDLAVGHIDRIVSRAIHLGYDLYDVLQIACINPIDHYQMNVGRLRVGDPADMIVVNDLRTWQVNSTIIDGVIVAENGESLIQTVPVEPINHFFCKPLLEYDFYFPAKFGKTVDVIRAVDGSLVTSRETATLNDEHGELKADVASDVLKLSVVNRYKSAEPAVAWICGFGLKHGAIASCVAHDSHNIVAVGVSDEDLARAVNLVIEQRGGIAAVGNGDSLALPLPVGGIMSSEDGFQVAQQYERIEAFAKQTLGSELTSPFMTLSFMSLLVIPSLKLSDKGLFDGETFQFA